jgi:hypothetical protein
VITRTGTDWVVLSFGAAADLMAPEYRNAATPNAIGTLTAMNLQNAVVQMAILLILRLFFF